MEAPPANTIINRTRRGSRKIGLGKGRSGNTSEKMLLQPMDRFKKRRTTRTMDDIVITHKDMGVVDKGMGVVGFVVSCQIMTQSRFSLMDVNNMPMTGLTFEWCV